MPVGGGQFAKLLDPIVDMPPSDRPDLFAMAPRARHYRELDAGDCSSYAVCSRRLRGGTPRALGYTDGRWTGSWLACNGRLERTAHNTAVDGRQTWARSGD
jgi:hypothetical protein